MDAARSIVISRWEYRPFFCRLALTSLSIAGVPVNFAITVGHLRAWRVASRTRISKTS
jgi:hypothetical protein